MFIKEVIHVPVILTELETREENWRQIDRACAYGNGIIDMTAVQKEMFLNNINSTSKDKKYFISEHMELVELNNDQIT